MSAQKNDDGTLISSYLDSLYTLSHSGNTVNGNKVCLNHFRRFAEEAYLSTVSSIIDGIKAGKLDPFKIINEFVVYLDRNGKQPQTIKLCIISVKGLCRHSGIKIYNEDFKQMVRVPKVRRCREEPVTKEILSRLMRNLPAKLQTAVLVASASGMRIGELVSLKIADIDFSSRPTKVRIKADITKTKETRETFLTAEATKALKDYIIRYFGWKENDTDDTILNQIIFGRTRLVKTEEDTFKPRKKDTDRRCTPQFLAEMSIVTTLSRHIQKIPELNRKNENGRKVIHFHAFRRFFRTTVGDAVGRDFAEALMGHHFYLDTYYNQPEEKRKEMYLRAEPYLTISDYTQVEKSLSKITERQKELEEENHIIKQLMQKRAEVSEPEETPDEVQEEIEPVEPQVQLYNVKCTKCGKFLGKSRTIPEGKQMQQDHSSYCPIFLISFLKEIKF